MKKEFIAKKFIEKRCLSPEEDDSLFHNSACRVKFQNFPRLFNIQELTHGNIRTILGDPRMVDLKLHVARSFLETSESIAIRPRISSEVEEWQLGMWSRGTLTDRFINLIFGEVIVIFLRRSPPGR